MSKDELAKAMADFSAKGGQVKKIEEGSRAIDPIIRNCQCGCRGDWTEHTMRLGERGIN
jgi:hypothetical protein